MIGHLICFFSTLLMSALFLYIARTYSRFEYNKHKVYTTLMSFGLLMCYPLQMIGIYYWIVNFDGYIDTRWSYYTYFVSRALPSIVCILTRPDEDCFACYNRCAPQKYSTFQFSNEEIFRKACGFTEDELLIFDDSDT